MQIILFILVLLVIALIFALVIIGVIGAHIMRFILWVRSLFSGKRPDECKNTSTTGSYSEPKVISDDEGEYVDFEEVK